MKAANRTDQTNVPDTLPQRQHLSSCLDCLGVSVCVRVCADKAVGLLFSVKGNWHRAVEL